MRVINFGAGPAAIPETVLQEAQAELLNWQGLGMSVMEAPHRGDAYLSLKASLEADIKDVLNVPDNYHILLLGFPARFQFACLAMNFLKHKAFYHHTGYWSKTAYEDACLQGHAVLADVAPADCTEFDYYYFTPNETLTGVSAEHPGNIGCPVIADATSTLFAKTFTVSEYDLLFAGVQKNLGPAGLSLVIVSDELLSRKGEVPVKLCDYQLQVEQSGMMATPPVFNIYMTRLVLSWLKEQGGVAALEARNRDKAKRLYEYVDSSDFYHNDVDIVSRSIHNVTFQLAQVEKTALFLESAEKKGLTGLKGHRHVGGLRASLYNALGMDAVDALIEHMDAFATKQV